MDLTKSFILGIILFGIAFNGLVVMGRHLITILMCVELMMLSVSFIFLIFSVHFDDLYGQIICLYILGVAGAEAAIGLGLLVAYNRLSGIISVKMATMLKGWFL